MRSSVYALPFALSSSLSDLADATPPFLMPSGSEFLVFLGCVFVVIWGAQKVYGIMADRKRLAESDEPKRRIVDQPLEIRGVHEHVPLARFLDLEKEMRNLFRDMDQDNEEQDKLIHALDERSKGIDRVERQVADLRKDMHDRMVTIGDNLSQLVGEVRARFNQSQK